MKMIPKLAGVSTIISFFKTACILVVLHIRLEKCLGLTSTSYSIHNSTRFPAVSVATHTHNTTAMISCARLCSQTPDCASFYAKYEGSGHVAKDWKCTLILGTLDEEKLQYTGLGFVGIESAGLGDVTLQDTTVTTPDSQRLVRITIGRHELVHPESVTQPEVTTDTTTKEVTQDVITTTDVTIFDPNHPEVTTYDSIIELSPPNMTLDPSTFAGYVDFFSMRVALYNCSYDFPISNKTASGTIGIVYNEVENKWPVFKNGCDTNFCQLVGFYGTIVQILSVGRIHGDVGFMVASPLCRIGFEEPYTPAFCNNSGNWEAHSPLQVGCVPSDCYRNNPDGEAIYSGTTSTTQQGLPCQNWDQHTPNLHHFNHTMFPADHSNMTLASNYCRDPSGTGSPWCYVDSPEGGWDFCDVPVCQIVTSL